MKTVIVQSTEHGQFLVIELADRTAGFVPMLPFNTWVEAAANLRERGANEEAIQAARHTVVGNTAAAYQLQVRK